MVCPMEPIVAMLRDYLVHASPIAVEEARGHGVEMLETVEAGGQR